MSFRIYILAMAMGLGAAATYAEKPAIIVNKDSDSPVAIELGKLSRINFVDNGLEFVTNGDEDPMDMSFADLAAIHFGSASSAVADEEVPFGAFKAVVGDAGATLTLHGVDDGTMAYVYSASGACVRALTVQAAMPIDIAALAHGLYIVRAGENAQKFVK